MNPTLKDILYSTNNQKILHYLLEHIEEEYYDRQISRLTGISRAGTNFALRELVKADLLQRNKKGKMVFYKLEQKNTFIKYLKIIQNITTLQPLIEKLIASSIRIILYGSASKGENRDKSDFDIFILSRYPKETKKTIFESTLRNRIQCIINTLNEFIILKRKNKLFCKEIEDGIVLWEEKKI